MRRILLISAGNISLLLGITGIFLPVLPTTPFLLLSAACFVRSSEKLYNRLVNHRILGPYIRSYLEYKAISPRAKTISIVTLWAFILSSVIFFASQTWLKAGLIIIALGVTVFLIRIKTLTKEMIDESAS